MAQWITRLPTEQKIPGSNPGTLNMLLSVATLPRSVLKAFRIFGMQMNY